MGEKSQYLKMFLSESEDYILLLNENILELEKNPAERKEIIAAAFRAIHSLKGMAAAMGYNHLTELTHRMENILDGVRQGRMEITAELIDLLLAGLDHLSQQVEEIREYGREREFSAAQENYLESLACFQDKGRRNLSREPRGASGAAKTAGGEENHGKKARAARLSPAIRVDIQKLDQLMNMAGELLLTKNRLEASIDRNRYRDILGRLDRVTMELQQTVRQMRLVPVSVMFNCFPRMIRDLSRQMGKEIDFKIEGGGTELDRLLIDELADPLMHLLRNSVDHGIELPEQRTKLGKKRTGQLLLRACRQGSKIQIEVRDDGRGIDTDQLVSSAVEQGIISRQEAQQLAERDKLKLIFAAGLSTAREVSGVSGRGVGLDVVKNAVKRLDGEICLESRVNKGSSFKISLPLTLEVTRALMVKIAGETFAIPLDDVSETRVIRQEEIRQVKGQDVILLREKRVPLMNSREIFDLHKLTEERQQEELPVVILNTGERQLALIVDELLGQQEIVIKSIGDYLQGVKDISGATVLSDGDVALILNVRNIA